MKEMLNNEGNQSNEESESEEDDKDGTLNHLQQWTLLNQNLSPLTKQHSKRCQIFYKEASKIVKAKWNPLEQSLFSIGKEMSKPKTRGNRKKIGKLIPVHVTAKSRRDYTHRGRVVGTLGMRPKDQENRVQMVVREEDDNVYHTLPKQKVKNKQVHSLTNAAECWC